MSNHTPEPWFDDRATHDQPYQNIKILGDENRGICWLWIDDAPVDDWNAEQRANAARIIDCVNACADMTDPAAEIAELKRQRDELLAALGVAIPLIKQARLDWRDQNTESYDEDVVTPYDAILYRPILSLLETKGSSS